MIRSGGTGAPPGAFGSRHREERKIMKPITDFMSRHVAHFDGQRPVVEAIDFMQKKGISSVVITEKKKTVGIFTERDVLLKLDFNDADNLRNVKLKDVMSRHLITADVGESYTNVMQLMKDHGIRHLPIQAKNKIVGIISLRDLLNNHTQYLENLLDEVIESFSAAVSRKDPYTAGHQLRVAKIACAIARQLGFTPHELHGLTMAAVVHDIGKICIPIEILSKPGILDDMEKGLIEVHSKIGYEILSGIEFEWPIADIVLQHHERVDGTGYPYGLKGDEILTEAKIIAVADVFEAIISHRPYRPSLGIKKAQNEIIGNRGSSFDAVVVDAFVKVLHQKDSDILKICQVKRRDRLPARKKH
jgi:putative nucleotidyltransferase with HDIG domain